MNEPNALISLRELTPSEARRASGRKPDVRTPESAAAQARRPYGSTLALVAQDRRVWPRWYRWSLVALCTLVLCSCSATHKPGPEMAGQGMPPVSYGPQECPPEMYAPPMYGPGNGLPPQYAAGVPQPDAAYGPWSPPGLATPWPYDEYLRDGGDRMLPAQVRTDWEVNGVEQEDTVAHYDTLDGRTLITPSNRVHIYAPKFCAVRKVDFLVEDAQIEVTRGIEKPLPMGRFDLTQVPATSLQREQASPQIGVAAANAYLMKQGDGALSLAQLPVGFREAYLPFEDLRIIRQGIYDNAEKARLAASVDAAIVWTLNQAVQVVIDKQFAVEERKAVKAESVFVVDAPGNPRLRIIKVASTQEARPGEFVDFTLRFDNVGQQVIGNVTVIDNLTNRLEYVAESQQSSRKNNFYPVENEGGSLALRWEFIEPLQVGEGGVIRFRCKVR